jgi:G3E family GTPase
MTGAPRIPVTLVTGFLGSGKTTLIRQILTHPDAGGALVIVNEFGEVGIDHDLLEASSDDTILLANGCLCCTIRGNLVDTLNDVLAQQRQNRLRAFDRVVVETSGVADPAYLSAFLFSDPTIAQRFRLAQIIVTCDAVAGAAALDRFPESRAQARVADRLLITKSDLAEPSAMAALEAKLRTLNPVAPITPVVQGAFDPGLFLASTGAEAQPGAGDARHHHDHTDRFQATTLTAAHPLTDAEIQELMEQIATFAGPHLLRLKGVIERATGDGLVVIQASMMVTHPPEYLPRQSIHQDGCGSLVIITEGASPTALVVALAPLGLAPSYRGPG